jgi:hypothetical protein
MFRNGIYWRTVLILCLTPLIISWPRSSLAARLAADSPYVTGHHVSQSPSWSVVPSPNIGTSDALFGVATISASDAWAVGYYTDSNNKDLTLIEQWNGTSWNIVPSPNGGDFNYLYSVAAVSASDIWAVGYYQNVGSVEQPLIEHWDGTSWSVVPGPSVNTASELKAVTAISTSDVWTVGEKVNSYDVNQTLIEHWNGTQWSIVPSPNVKNTYDNVLEGVTAVSTSNVWTVGYYDEPSNGSFYTLTEHWNGTSWSIVPSPNVPGTNDDQLLGVASLSACGVAAVGIYIIPGVAYTLVERWNGTSWSIVPSPNVSSASGSELFSVAIAAKNAAWTVGNWYNSNFQNQTLIEQWDGTQLSIVSSPNVGSQDALIAVAANSATDVWAVGYSGTLFPGPAQTLIEHYCC